MTFTTTRRRTPHVAVVRGDPWEHEAARAYLATRPELVLDDTAADVALVLTRAVDAAVVEAVRTTTSGRLDRPRLVVVSDRPGPGEVPLLRTLGATHLLDRATASWEEVVAALLDPTGHGRASVPSEGWSPHLSAREVEVIRMLADGATTVEVSEALHYSERTVKNVLGAVSTRLGARNRVHTVARAVRAGLI